MTAFSSFKLSAGLVLIFSILPRLSTAQSTTNIVDATSAGSAFAAPECAISCLESSEQSSTQCGGGDQACRCQHAVIIQDAISSCLQETTACSERDLQSAVGYYPQYCASLGLSVTNVAAETGDGGILTAAGSAPTPISSATDGNVVLTATDTAAITTRTVTSDNADDGPSTGLTLPAILGVTLGAVLVVVVFAVLLVYSHVRRQRMKRRTRVEFLYKEFRDYHFPDFDQETSTHQRPPRCTSVGSNFMVQPSPLEKDVTSNGFDFDFGTNISRTSTLVSVSHPPPARIRGNVNKELPEIHHHEDEPRSKAQHVEEIQNEVNADTVHAQPGSSQVGPPRTSSRPLKQFIAENNAKIRASLRLSRPITPSSIYSNHRSNRNTLQTKDTAGAEDGFDRNNKI